ncbi:MAG: hypothetical protein V1839_03270 [archaeon]
MGGAYFLYTLVKCNPPREPNGRFFGRAIYMLYEQSAPLGKPKKLSDKELIASGSDLELIVNAQYPELRCYLIRKGKKLKGGQHIRIGCQRYSSV